MIKDFYIPFNVHTALGGPTTFMKNLKDYLDSINFKYIETSENARMIFFPVSADFNVLKQIKEREGKIIQRLDGIYYPEKHGNDYLVLNQPIKEIYQKFADFVVFQSEYSKKQCFALLGEKPIGQYEIIVNGVNKKIFYPAGNQPVHSGQIKFITTGNFRSPDMIEPIIKALDLLKGQFDFKLIVAGAFRDDDLKKLIERDYVEFVGEKDLEGIADLLRQSDIYLFSHLNPPCPNAVLEAISCGLPVVSFNSGSLKELLFFAPDLLAPVTDEIFQKYTDFDANKLAQKISLTVKNYSQYKQLALNNADLYDFKICGQKYLDIFKRVKKDYWQKRLLLKTFSPDLFIRIINQVIKRLEPDVALRYLLRLGKGIYALEGRESIRYGQGTHTKHKHIKYHQFFIENVSPGQKILDIGCGKGELDIDLAKNVDDIKIVGLELNTHNFDWAQKNNSHPNIQYINQDVLTYDFQDKFDVIILSNVLEHISRRAEFLNKLINKIQPQYFLIRVPMYERDWRVPLMDELGMNYYLDQSHYLEYHYETLVEELNQAGLKIDYLKTNWGEYWLKASTNVI